MVLLTFLGTEGSDGSNLDLRKLFKIGRGSAENYKQRAAIAISSLKGRYYNWPDQEERKLIANRMLNDYGTGNVDHTNTACTCVRVRYESRHNYFGPRIFCMPDDVRIILFLMLQLGEISTDHDKDVKENYATTKAQMVNLFAPLCGLHIF